jgi:Putative zinc-finger
MPNTESFAAITEKDLPTVLFERNPDRHPLKSRWLCPDDHTVASYIDGRLSRYKRWWIEFHLARCPACRLVVADVVRTERETAVQSVPVALVSRAAELSRRRSFSWRVTWIPAATLGVVALAMAMGFVFLRQRQRLLVIAPSSPTAPLIAKSDPPRVANKPVVQVERSSRNPELVPILISPRPNIPVTAKRLHLTWKAVPQANNYLVRLVGAEGDMAWEGQSEKSVLQLPSDLMLKDGNYYVLITAYLPDGRVAKSPPARLVVKQ